MLQFSHSRRWQFPSAAYLRSPMPFYILSFFRFFFFYFFSVFFFMLPLVFTLNLISTYSVLMNPGISNLMLISFCLRRLAPLISKMKLEDSKVYFFWDVFSEHPRLPWILPLCETRAHADLPPYTDSAAGSAHLVLWSWLPWVISMLPTTLGTKYVLSDIYWITKKAQTQMNKNSSDFSLCWFIHCWMNYSLLLLWTPHLLSFTLHLDLIFPFTKDMF